MTDLTRHPSPQTQPGRLRDTTDPSGLRLGFRCALWFILAGIGNGVVLSTLFTLDIAPVPVEWDTSLTWVAPFVLPLYSPTLLVFTLLLAFVEGRGRRMLTNAGDTEQADRLIAQATRLALTIILSFASLVLIIEPTMIAQVMIALLISFVTIVRTELLAPPPVVSPEIAHRRAQQSLHRSNLWSCKTLGPDWRSEVPKRAWPSVVLLFAAAFVPTTFVLVIGGAVVWGPQIVLNPSFVLMCTVSAMMPATLVIAWLSGADKAESPRVRTWRVLFLVIMTAFGTVSIAAVYLLFERRTWWMGGTLIIASLLIGTALLSRRAGRRLRLRRNVELRWTDRRRQRIEKHAAQKEEEWIRSRARTPTTVRMLTRLLRPFHRAAQLVHAEQHG